MILVGEGLGGQAMTLLPVVDALHNQVPKARIFGFTSLPKEALLRSNFAALKGSFEAHGLQGWLPVDQLQPEQTWKSADTAMAALIAATASAQLHDEEATQLINLLSDAMPREPGSVVSMQFTHATVVAEPWQVEGEPLGYSVSIQRVVEKVQDGLRTLEAGKGMFSLVNPLPIGEQDCVVCDVVIAPLGYDERHQRDDLREVEDRVRAGYDLRLAHLRSSGTPPSDGMLYGRADYRLKFGCLTAVVDPKQPQCSVIVARLAAVKNGKQKAAEISAVPDHLKLPATIPIPTSWTAVGGRTGTQHALMEETNGHSTHATGG